MLVLTAALIATTAACSMLLKPTTSFDRRLIARSYGKIISQSNPDCDNCTDRFLVQKDDGCVITLVVRYDGRVQVYQ